MHECSCGVCSCRSDPLSVHEADFRRNTKNIIAEKFNGDVFAYIKCLTETIETLENNLENISIDFLASAS